MSESNDLVTVSVSVDLPVTSTLSFDVTVDPLLISNVQTKYSPPLTLGNLAPCQDFN